jgi:hypothetical protein
MRRRHGGQDFSSGLGSSANATSDLTCTLPEGGILNTRLATRSQTARQLRPLTRARKQVPRKHHILCAPASTIQKRTCETQLAIMAPLELPFLAVTTYSPPEMRPMALAMSTDMPALVSLIFFFWLSDWPRSVPVSSYAWYLHDKRQEVFKILANVWNHGASSHLRSSSNTLQNCEEGYMKGAD